MTRGTRMSTEAGDEVFDDDGRPQRTGTMFTATAHIITAVIGSGVLSLAWALAQLGWIAGPIAILAFSVITWFTSTLLADCYRAADGTRNYVYKDAVRSYLGGLKVQLCGLAQYSNLVGVTVGYSITTAISMVAIKKSVCFHKYGHDANCRTSNNPFIVSFGVIQIILCQVPNFHKLSILSFIAAVMSFAYSSIGLGLAIARIAEGRHVKTSITGIPVGEDYSSMDKMWNTLTSLGNIAFAYAFSVVLIEIQDTIKSGVPENKVMKQATSLGITISTVFYMLCGVLGYAAFGHNAPGNFLTGFGFYEPFWLVAIANICIAVHLFGAYQLYRTGLVSVMIIDSQGGQGDLLESSRSDDSRASLQVFCQPIFGAVEGYCRERWAGNKFFTREYPVFCGSFNVNMFRLVWRTCYVVITTVLAMLLPFFNDFVGLIGAISFFPLTVYFPVEMYISRSKIPMCSLAWFGLKLLCVVCLVLSVLAAAGSVQGLIQSLQDYEPFHSVS